MCLYAQFVGRVLNDQTAAAVCPERKKPSLYAKEINLLEKALRQYGDFINRFGANSGTKRIRANKPPRGEGDYKTREGITSGDSASFSLP